MIDDVFGQAVWNKLVEEQKREAREADERMEKLATSPFPEGTEIAYRIEEPDPVEMPSHYTQLPVECIDITEHFSFTLGNAIKYIWRADHKGKPIEDLEKSIWYLRREIERRKREGLS